MHVRILVAVVLTIAILLCAAMAASLVSARHEAQENREWAQIVELEAQELVSRAAREKANEEEPYATDVDMSDGSDMRSDVQ